MPVRVEPTPVLPGLSPVGGKAVVARFDGGCMSSDGGLLALREVEQRLSTATWVVTALIARGHLPSRVEVNPANRCPRQVVRQEDLDEFMGRYVSLHAAAMERGVHHLRLKSVIADAGIRPPFDPKDVGATFYERSSIANLES